MAKVPLYQTGEVMQKSLPEARQSSIASPELFVGISGAKSTAALGEGLANVGVAGMRYASDLQAKEDTAIVQNKVVDLLKRTNEFEAQAKLKQGLNAATLPTLAEEEWTKINKDLTDGLTDRQKAAYSILAQRHQPSFIGGINNHAVSQINKAQEDSFRSSLDTFQSSAAANPDSAPTMQEETKRTVRAWSQIKGLDKATADRAMMTELTKLHANVITSLETQGKTDAAKGYFYTHIEEIAGDKRDEIKKVFETSDKLAASQAFADDVEKRGLTLEQSLTEARAKFTGDEEKNAIIEVKQRFIEKDAIKKQDQEDAFGLAWSAAVDNGKGLKGIPAVIWNRMRPDQRNSIENEVYQRQQRYAGGGAVKTDQNKWHDIQQQSFRDPQKFIERDLRLDKKYLSDSDFQELSKMQAQVKKDIDKPDKIKRVFTIGQQVTQILDSAGIKSVANTKGKPDPRALATRASNDALQREAAAKGKDVDQLSDDEVQKVMDKLLIKGATSDGWFADKKYAFELKPEERSKFRIEFADVPADFVTEARAYAKTKKLKLTDEQIAIKYSEYITKK